MISPAVFQTGAQWLLLTEEQVDVYNKVISSALN